MNRNRFYRYYWIAPAFILALVLSGCTGGFTVPATPTSPGQPPVSSPTPTTGSSVSLEVEETPDAPGEIVPNTGGSSLYHDNFTDPASGWPEARFDNYFIGYHEPEYYHVEITSPNSKTAVFEPEKTTFDDATIEVKAFTASSKTAEAGDFSFGIAFRRSGDQYYAFAISQRAKKWYVLKSTPNALTILAEGTDENIHNADEGDLLRVDAQGPDFTFSVNDQAASHVTDTDYAAGEVGFFVQTSDVQNAHVHFDDLDVRPFEGVPAPEQDSGTLYHDNFTNPTSGWPEAKFDNYFIGYHEPENYHVEVVSPNYKTMVFEPDKAEFSDATIEVTAFTASSKTAETGDFSFGVVFRRSGDQYYAFAISQRTKNWYVLKSAPNALSILAEGAYDGIHDVDVGDVLRVDAQGENFSLSINGQVVSQVADAGYASGEVGFFVQTLDATTAHVHFDDLAIRQFEGTLVQELKPGTLVHDDLTNPASGWPEAKFDNYFIGYHEPENYHIEVTSPNYKTAVFEPGKKEFDDVTIEVKAFTASSKTAETGDFSFGVVFRRSGDQYYAFAISQRTKKWYVLKSAPNALSILAEGTEDSIHDVDIGDVLRVDAQGSHFFLSINDRLVSQVTDASYATGEVGFFVQTLDAPKAHVHFDELNISKFEPSLVCEVRALFLNVRSGPAIDTRSVGFVSKGDTIEPLGISADKQWLLVDLDGSGKQAWVFNAKEFVTCDAAVDILPVASPGNQGP